MASKPPASKKHPTRRQFVVSGVLLGAAAGCSAAGQRQPADGSTGIDAASGVDAGDLESRVGQAWVEAATVADATRPQTLYRPGGRMRLRRLFLLSASLVVTAFLVVSACGGSGTGGGGGDGVSKWDSALWESGIWAP
jgi:hypothetical protein